MTDSAARLAGVIDGVGEVAIAVSGGVDSVTLMTFAATRTKARAVAYHAVSPAVPPAATARVKAHAAAQGWRLVIVGAGEFDDPDYLRNPVNRCYFCKSNLYARLGAETDTTICSGANLDDLGDYRPGLGAAAERGVRHPFVEAGFAKADIRALATKMGLVDVADLPAQPCLASRVETGLAIEAAALALVDEVERRIAARIGPGDIRCRITHDGVRIEAPPDMLAAIRAEPGATLRSEIEGLVAAEGRAFDGYAPYRRGAAFLRGEGE